MPTLKLKRSTSAGAAPGSLVSGEVAINEADEKLFYRKGDGSVGSMSLSSPGGAASGISLTPAGTVAATNVQAAIQELDGDIQAKLSSSLVSSYALTLLNDLTASEARGTLGLGTAATQDTTAFAAASHTHAASAITSGQLAVARGGTGVDASTAANGRMLIGNGSGFTLANLTAGDNIQITNAAGSVTIAATGATARADASLSGPSLPIGGQLWWNPTEGNLKIWYDDGNSQQWVDAASPEISTHTHTSSQISDFGESVDDRVAGLLQAGTGITLAYNDAGNTLTITSTATGSGSGDVVGPASATSGNFSSFNGITGKLIQDSGYNAASFAASSHTHSIANVTGLQTALDGKLASSAVSAYGLTLIDDADAATARTTLGLGSAATQASTAFAAATHTHAIADVTGLQTALNGKLASSSVSAYGLTLIDDADAATARTTLGLGTAATQASTAFAAATHTHTPTDITGFDEAVDDRVSALLVAGSNVTLSYNDAANTLTISSTGSTGGGVSILDDLTDVVISTAASGNLLRYNGTSWVNYADSNYAAASHTHDLSTAAITGTLPVSKGGTGVTTLTGLVKASGAAAFTAAVAGNDYHDTNSTIDGGTY